MKTAILLFSIMIVGVGCSKKEGCTDRNATNYESDAEKDNGSCNYPRQQIIGSYNSVTITENGGGSWLPGLNIISGSNTADVYFIFNPVCPVSSDTIKGTISSNVITIPFQEKSDVNHIYNYSGSGTFSTGSFNLSLNKEYTAGPNGTGTYSYTIIGIK
jgi:hypothetical protein